MNPADAIPQGVQAAYDVVGLPLRVIPSNINRTFVVLEANGSERLVLQRLHPVFGARVNEDIDAVTRHLQARGHMTPLLIRTVSGALWTEDADAHVWR